MSIGDFIPAARVAMGHKNSSDHPSISCLTHFTSGSHSYEIGPIDIFRF